MKTVWKRCLLIFLTVLFLSPAYAGGTDTKKATNARPTLKWEIDEENTPETKPSREPTAKAQATLKKLNKQQTLQRERIRNVLKGERILDYDISAIIDKDASMIVTERITVNVENIKIKRGITRTYPIKTRDGEDGLYKFGFELLSTKLDGEEAKHKSLSKGMMFSMAIGDEKKPSLKASIPMKSFTGPPVMSVRLITMMKSITTPLALTSPFQLTKPLSG